MDHAKYSHDIHSGYIDISKNNVIAKFGTVNRVRIIKGDSEGIVCDYSIKTPRYGSCCADPNNENFKVGTITNVVKLKRETLSDPSGGGTERYTVTLDDTREEITFENNGVWYFDMLKTEGSINLTRPQAVGGKKSRRKRNNKKSRKNRRKSRKNRRKSNRRH
jgi:hypothetical protein